MADILCPHCGKSITLEVNTGTKETNKLDIILGEVAKYYKLDKELLSSKYRSLDIVKARQIACFIAMDLQNISVSDIAVALKRDHMTIVHARSKAQCAILDNNAIIKGEIDDINSKVEGCLACANNKNYSNCRGNCPLIDKE